MIRGDIKSSWCAHLIEEEIGEIGNMTTEEIINAWGCNCRG